MSKSEAEKAAEEAYRQYYARMIGIRGKVLHSHAEVSINFYLEGVKWAIEQAEAMVENTIDDGEQTYPVVLLSDLKQLTERRR